MTRCDGNDTDGTDDTDCIRWRCGRRQIRQGSARGQANLAAVAVALVVLTGIAVGTVVLAETALVGASRDASDGRVATSLSDRLLAGDSPATVRPGVLSERRVSNLSARTVDGIAPAAADAAVVVRVDNETVFERGTPDGGVTVLRAALAGQFQSRSTRIDLSTLQETTLPHRTRRVEFDVTTGDNTTLDTVRVNDRVVLHNASGLDGDATVSTSVRRRSRLSFDTVVETSTNTTASGGSAGSDPGTDSEPSPVGTVEIRYEYLVLDGATLEVTVDA